MNTGLVDVLRERVAEYYRLRHDQEIYSAFVRLGEIANCVQHHRVDLQGHPALTGVLTQIEISPTDVKIIWSQARSKIERLLRILDSSGALSYEEILLVITMRTELDLIRCYLADNELVVFPSTELLDEAILRVAHSRRSAPIYRAAQEAARKNWGVPLSSSWLGTAPAD